MHDGPGALHCALCLIQPQVETRHRSQVDPANGNSSCRGVWRCNPQPCEWEAGDINSKQSARDCRDDEVRIQTPRACGVDNMRGLEWWWQIKRLQLGRVASGEVVDRRAGVGPRPPTKFGQCGQRWVDWRDWVDSRGPPSPRTQSASSRAKCRVSFVLSLDCTLGLPRDTRAGDRDPLPTLYHIIRPYRSTTTVLRTLYKMHPRHHATSARELSTSGTWARPGCELSKTLDPPFASCIAA